MGNSTDSYIEGGSDETKPPEWVNVKRSPKWKRGRTGENAKVTPTCQKFVDAKLSSLKNDAAIPETIYALSFRKRFPHDVGVFQNAYGTKED